MCTKNENNSKENISAKEWREQMSKLVENAPDGVSLVTICSTEVDRQQGMIMAGVSGKKGDVMFMLNKVLEVDGRIHKLFEESKKNSEILSHFKNDDLKSFMAGFFEAIRK